MAKKMEKRDSWCCLGSGKKGFPTFAAVLLVIGALWILSDIGIVTFKVPWFPVILVIIAIGWIVDNYRK